MTDQDKNTATEGGSESSSRNLLKFNCPECGTNMPESHARIG